MLNLKVNMKVNNKIYIAGHTGMVGSALTRKFIAESTLSKYSYNFSWLGVWKANNSGPTRYYCYSRNHLRGKT